MSDQGSTPESVRHRSSVIARTLFLGDCRFLFVAAVLAGMLVGCRLPHEFQIQSPELRDPTLRASVLDFRHGPNAGRSDSDARPRHQLPCDESHSPQTDQFQDDVRGFVPLLKDDVRGIANRTNAVVLGAALAGAIGIRQDLDGDVRENTARHPERWGKGSEVLGYFGDVQYQVPVLLGLYAYSLRRQDPELHDLAGSLLSAYTITGLTDVTIKAIANTDRPSDDWNGGQFGFPSFHAASTFSIAAVLDEYYGPRVGLPAYALAGLIGWSRIDERDHDLSDVVFGAALGYVIGKSVAGRHLTGDSRVHLLPYVHPTDGTGGLMIDLPY